jgi:signal transduction histidine kinase
MDQITEFFKKLLDSSDWPARWHCGRWTEFHGWLYIISDLLVWSAYFTIPLIIIKYISKRHDARFVRLYFLFAAFILACGSTHFFDAITFWIPVYRMNALVRLITGILSWITVFYLIKFLPQAFALKSQTEMENEIEQRHQQILEVNKQLRELSSHLQNVREEERIQISRDIHDELGQQLTGLKMDVHWLRNRIKTNDESIKQKTADIIDLIDETVRSVRRISSSLRPSMLDDLGLIAALEWHSEEVAKRTGIDVSYTSAMQCIDLPIATATDIFRIYQEALTNAVRHANAHKITSSLQLKDNHLLLQISDDGDGMDLSAIDSKKTLGLIGIKERTFALGGKYELKSQPGNGTEIKIDIPIFPGN